MIRKQWRKRPKLRSDEERVRLYVFRVRRNHSLRRASNYTLALAVLFGLGGVALGLFPEVEKLERLREEVKVRERELAGLRWDAQRLTEEAELLKNGDLDFLETMGRRRIRNLQAPDERSLRIPPEMNERMNALDEPGRGDKGEENRVTAP